MDFSIVLGVTVEGPDACCSVEGRVGVDVLQAACALVSFARDVERCMVRE